MGRAGARASSMCVRCGMGIEGIRLVAPGSMRRESVSFIERGVCLLTGIAEGTYKTNHAEAAKLYYTTR